MYERTVHLLAGRQMRAGTLCVILTGLCCAESALASDQVLRAFYCTTVLGYTIAQEQQTIADIARYAEPLRSALLKEDTEILQALTANHDRLRAYALTHINPNDPSEALQLAGAKQRGKIDSRQCAAEISTEAATCASKCTPKCVLDDANCLGQCDTQCGMPTCARTLACVNPTWLPY